MARSDNICRTTSDAMSCWPLVNLKIHPFRCPIIAFSPTQSIGPGINPVDPNSSPNVQVTHTVNPPTVFIHSLTPKLRHPPQPRTLQQLLQHTLNELSIQPATRGHEIQMENAPSDPERPFRWSEPLAKSGIGRLLQFFEAGKEECFHGGGDELDGQRGCDFVVADAPGRGAWDAGDRGCVDRGTFWDRVRLCCAGWTEEDDRADGCLDRMWLSWWLKRHDERVELQGTGAGSRIRWRRGTRAEGLSIDTYVLEDGSVFDLACRKWGEGCSIVVMASPNGRAHWQPWSMTASDKRAAK